MSHHYYYQYVQLTSHQERKETIEQLWSEKYVTKRCNQEALVASNLYFTSLWQLVGYDWTEVCLVQDESPLVLSICLNGIISSGKKGDNWTITDPNMCNTKV